MLSYTDVTFGWYMNTFLTERSSPQTPTDGARARLGSHDAKGRCIHRFPPAQTHPGWGACMVVVLVECHTGLVLRWLQSREREQPHRRLTLYAEGVLQLGPSTAVGKVPVYTMQSVRSCCARNLEALWGHCYSLRVIPGHALVQLQQRNLALQKLLNRTKRF